MIVSSRNTPWAMRARRLGALTLLGLSGCTHLPITQEAIAPLRSDLSERHPSIAIHLPDPADAMQAEVSELPDLAAAHALALFNDPQRRQAIVDLGISETEWRDARRPGNPTLIWLRHRAMVSIPSFDNNRFQTEVPVEYYLTQSRNVYQPFVNHAVSSIYPPGSTFKIVPGSASLQSVPSPHLV